MGAGAVLSERGLAKILDEMTEHDINPPGMPGVWLEPMRSLKLLKYPDRVPLFEGTADPDQEGGTE